MGAQRHVSRRSWIDESTSGAIFRKPALRRASVDACPIPIKWATRNLLAAAGKKDPQQQKQKGDEQQVAEYPAKKGDHIPDF